MVQENANSAARFRALGDPSRLKAMQVLCCCPEAYDAEVGGVIGGTGCCRDARIASGESDAGRQLIELEEAGLVRILKNGPYTMCSVERSALMSLSTLLADLATGGQTSLLTRFWGRPLTLNPSSHFTLSL